MLEDKEAIVKFNQKFLSKYKDFNNENGVVQYKDDRILISYPFGKRELQKMIVLVLRYDQGKGNGFVSLKNIEDMSKLVDRIDPSRYYNDKAAMDHLDFLKVIIPLVKEGYATEDIVYRCKQEMDENFQTNVIKELDMMMDTYLKTPLDAKAFVNSIYEYLQFSSVLIFCKSIEEEIFQMDMYKLKPDDPCKKIIKQAKKMIKQINKLKIEDATEHEFNLDKKSMTDIVQYLIDEEKNNAYAICTGIKALNYMIRGFMPGKLYLFLAGSGVFKSNMLLYIAYWAKVYNTINTRDKTKKPAVLFITNENSVEENYERLFSIAGGQGSVGIHTQVEVMETFKKVGFEINDDNPTQVFFIYRGYNTIDADDIKDIIDEFREIYGYEIRLLIIDYMKRLRPIFQEKDERLKLGAISNDLKRLAVDYHIPVVTAQQTNRAANISVKEAMESNKRDVGKVNHQTGISGSWDIIENVDWAMALTVLNRCPDTGKRMLCMYELKKRFKGFAKYDYFEHPFVGESKLMLVEDIYKDKSESRLEYELRNAGFIVEDYIENNKYYKRQVKNNNAPNWEKQPNKRVPFDEFKVGNETTVTKENEQTDMQGLLSKIYYDIDIPRASRYINIKNGSVDRMRKRRYIKVGDCKTVFTAPQASVDYYDLMKMAERRYATKKSVQKARKKKEKKKRKKEEEVFDFSAVKGFIDDREIPVVKKRIENRDYKDIKNRDEINIGDYIFYSSKSDDINLADTRIKVMNDSNSVLDNFPYMDLDYSLKILDSITEEDTDKFVRNLKHSFKPKKYVRKKYMYGGGVSFDSNYLKKKSEKEDKKFKKEEKKLKKEKKWEDDYESLDTQFVPMKDMVFAPSGINHNERMSSLMNYKLGEQICRDVFYINRDKFAKKVIKAYKKFFKYLDNTIYSTVYGSMSDSEKNDVIDKIFEKYNNIQNIIWDEIVNYEKFLYDGTQWNTDCPNPFLVGVDRKIKRIDMTFYSIKKIAKLKKKYVIYDHSIPKKEAKKLDRLRIKNIKLLRDCLLGTFFSRSIDSITDSIELSRLLHKYERKELKNYDAAKKGIANYEVKLNKEEREEMATLREARRRQILKSAEEHIKSKYGDIPVQYFDEEVQRETLGHKVPEDFYANLEYKTALENLEDMNDNWNQNQVFHEITGRRGNTFPEFQDRHNGLPNNSLADYASAIADGGATPDELEHDYPGCYEEAVDRDNKRWRKVYQRLKNACEAAERIRIGNDEDILEDKLDDIINAELDKIDADTVTDWRKEKGMISTDKLDDMLRYF